MSFEIGLIYLALAASVLFAVLSATGVLSRWPKIFYVTALSNASVLVLYYLPGLSGHPYYLLGMLKIIPLILLLVYLAQRDPSPNWTYRAICCVLIMQIITSGWHVYANLESPYYDQLSLAATVIELIIIMLGGFNVRISYTLGHTDLCRRSADCSAWVRRDQKGGGHT